jgi:hypothetical protein
VLSLQGAFEFRVGGQERVEETHELRPARALLWRKREEGGSEESERKGGQSGESRQRERGKERGRGIAQGKQSERERGSEGVCGG